MAKPCGKCGGSGWVGPRSDLGKALGFSSGGPCRICGGSGEDKRWGEKTCRGCYNTIEYRYDWTNVPDYCSDCRQDKYKQCANPHCNGSVRYKVFWDRIPDYCQTCKGMYTSRCANPKCGQLVKNHVEADRPKTHCNSCFQMSRRRGVDVVKGTRLEQWLPMSGHISVKDYGDRFHVSISFVNGGGHVSGEVDKYSTETWEVHGTLYHYDEKGKRIKNEDTKIND